MTTSDQPKKNLMILVVKGKAKKSRDNLNKVFEKKTKIFIYVLLSIF